MSGKMSVDDLIQELLQYRVCAGGFDHVRYDPATATSVHNLGHSVNVVLTNATGGLAENMGVGVDIVSPAQAVDYFEHNSAEDFDELVEDDRLLQVYLLQFGVSSHETC